MENSILSNILNPVRMRIIQMLIKNDTATVQQIAKDLPDIPQASLYRHLNKLVNSKIISVVQENKIRGTFEKVYKLERNPYTAIGDKLDSGNKGEQFDFFYNFLMALLGDFEEYMSWDKADLQRDGAIFRSAAMYMDDEEYLKFINELKNIFNKVKDNEPSEKRKLRKITTISIPCIDE